MLLKTFYLYPRIPGSYEEPLNSTAQESNCFGWCDNAICGGYLLAFQVWLTVLVYPISLLSLFILERYHLQVTRGHYLVQLALKNSAGATACSDVSTSIY